MTTIDVTGKEFSDYSLALQSFENYFNAIHDFNEETISLYDRAIHSLYAICDRYFIKEELDKDYTINLSEKAKEDLLNLNRIILNIIYADKDREERLNVRRYAFDKDVEQSEFPLELDPESVINDFNDRLISQKTLKKVAIK